MSALEKSGLVNKPDRPHNLVNIWLILSTFGTFAITLVFNGLAGSGAGVPDIFYSTVGDISDMFELFITPAGFAFSIWILIYLWLSVSLVIFIVTIFLQTDQGRLYLSPAIASPSVTATLTVNFILNLAWIFIWDRSDHVNVSKSCKLYFQINPDIEPAHIGLCYSILDRHHQHSSRSLHGKEYCGQWSTLCQGSSFVLVGCSVQVLSYSVILKSLINTICIRIILNGLATYTTWTVVASLINLTTALIYAGKVDDRDASLAALSLLVIIHCTWFVLENFVVDKYARFVLTPYLVIIWAVNAIRAKKMDDPEVPQEIKDFILAILIIASLTFVVRIALVIYKIIKKPLYQEH